ncbi:MAG TPA: multidrug efflux RND transporter permease subunit [Candidatus Baltobacteraceae bacterium]|jgi:multidrug efflux pump|nr:multidrug efflux RND transporter permease subunit [Candidatus Baltobacteraceae bacterium]
MSFSSTFIHRPVATTLLTAAVALAGGVAFRLLPVAPLPQVDFPTISVGATLPGASPEIMASAVAAPLEKQFGHIAGVTEMTSSSLLGTTGITLQFDLNRNIDGAARDVQAAINAARSYLPANLPSNPTWRKVNPADAPIMIVALTSDIYTRGQMYDIASSIMQQRLSQVDGVGQVVVGGSSLPAVRVDVNPVQLENCGLSLTNVQSVLNGANANLPKGQISDDKTTADILANDQLLKAEYYRPLVIGYHNGAAVRLQDVADVEDSVQDVRNAGFADGKPAVLLVVFKQPQANIMETVDHIRAALPSLEASAPAEIKFTITLDRTTTIRASVHDVEVTLLISIALVILVVFIFLRDARTTLIPSVAVPVSLIGTFGVMYLLGYSIDNLSLMALTISTGFVVDDAIVVIENITRYLEQGLSPVEAALRGAGEIGFTVLSISVSLVTVFAPILLMGGIVGRLFREFAVTISVAILVSLVVSLSTTPMMCARLLKREKDQKHGRIHKATGVAFDWILHHYERSLRWVLKHQFFVLCILLVTIALNFYLFAVVPKGFFPQQDTGALSGTAQGTEDISFQSMSTKLLRFIDIVKADPAVSHLVGFTGGGGGTTTDQGRMFITLKPLGERTNSADEVVARLRGKCARVAGATCIFSANQDLRIGGRQSQAQYQYTIQSDNLQDLVTWGPKLLDEMKKLPGLADVNSDQQNDGLQSELTYDRPTAMRLGLTASNLDGALYGAFGQSLVSTMYTSLNQYFVVMEVAPRWWQSPAGLNSVYLQSTSGGEVPLSAVTRVRTDTAPIQVNHQGQFPAVTASFNLPPGVSLGDAVNNIDAMEQRMGMPSSIHGSFSGTAQAFQSSLSGEPFLIATALLAVYIVLGILYESYIHPITILSTLPSAGVGAVLFLMLFHIDLSIIALIGVILLIGIVKKNGILMVDFAIEAERKEGKSPEEAIFQASILRFRPILMTTMAAICGALPLVLSNGTGSELRRPLGVAIVGGLMFSQVLTLYTTPVVYLYFDRMSIWWRRSHGKSTTAEAAPAPAPA